jgi:hypothetical protein
VVELSLHFYSSCGRMPPICKMKRCNPVSTSGSSSCAVSTAAADEMKKRLEERMKQDQRYFPTLPVTPAPSICGKSLK